MQRGRARAAPTPGVKSRRAPLPPPRALRGAPQSELSVVAAFDEHMRNAAVLQEGGEKVFAQFVSKATLWMKRWREAEVAREQLAAVLKERDREILAKDYKIKQARKIVEDERKERLLAEAERDAFVTQLGMLKDILLSGGGRGIDNETLERVRHIDTTTRKNSPFKYAEARLPAVEESVESILDVSDLSFDETRDEESRLHPGHPRYKRRSSGRVDKANKRRKSRSMGTILDGDKILSTTTKVTVDNEGNAHAESIIEAVPVSYDLKKKARKSRESRGERRVTYDERAFEQEFSPSAPPCPPDDGTHCWNAVHAMTPGGNYSPQIKRHISNASSIPNRPHTWVKKKMLVGERCGPCGQRIGFSKECMKCRDCFAICHVGCRSDVPLPCVAASNRTPTNKSQGNLLADHAPAEPPMIPALLRHCIREVEGRGLIEVGIYRIPGNEAEANEVLEKFLRGKGPPVLSKYEIHVIASTVKKFLRSLKEPIIPLSLWKVFVDAANNPDATYGEAAMYQAISELPRPNRDTLAFMILHLQKVAESPYCKMDMENLSKIWGPTIVGHSSPDPMGMMAELPLQKAVVKALLCISSDYWDTFLQSEQERLFPGIHTPEERGERASFFPSALKTGAVAKRTRSRQMARQQYFQSPMLK